MRFFVSAGTLTHAESVLAVSIPAGADLMTERRRAARQGGFKAGMIEPGQAGRVRCMIRNISSTGAFLELAAPI